MMTFKKLAKLLLMNAYDVERMGTRIFSNENDSTVEWTRKSFGEGCRLENGQATDGEYLYIFDEQIYGYVPDIRLSYSDGSIYLYKLSE